MLFLGPMGELPERHSYLKLQRLFLLKHLQWTFKLVPFIQNIWHKKYLQRLCLVFQLIVLNSKVQNLKGFTMGNISIMSTPKAFGMSTLVRFLIVQLEMLRSSASVTEAKDLKMRLGRWLSGESICLTGMKKNWVQTGQHPLRKKEEGKREGVTMSACNSSTERQREEDPGTQWTPSSVRDQVPKNKADSNRGRCLPAIHVYFLHANPHIYTVRLERKVSKSVWNIA